jgi:dihydroorotate dehydrogenase (NAD+) catalytic subunit
MTDLSVTLGRLNLRNPVLVASGTFGYAKEMAPFVAFEKLGGVVPKTVTAAPRAGNKPPRTVETASGMLNAIGLDNDGLEHFLTHHLPYLRTLPTAIVGNIAGKSEDEFVQMAARVHAATAGAAERAGSTVGVASASNSGMSALELNLSCPNVSGGTDFASDPELTKRIVRRCRDACPDLPLIAKLTPNVTDITLIARAAADGGADAVSAVNTFVGMAINWRTRKPILGNVTGGLSGPAIKPLALRAVWRVAQLKAVPVIAVGGIGTIDDVMDFLVVGATAVQVGTANFYDPTASVRIVDELPAALAALGATSVREVVGTLKV